MLATIPVTQEEKNANNIIEIIKRMPSKPQSGDLVEGRVIGHDKSVVYVDLAPFGTGAIFGREYLNARDIIKKVNIGDAVTAKVVEMETEDGYIGLSLREAKQALVWKEAEQAIKEKAILELTVKDVNKGGLIMEWHGLDGFLPTSQLRAEHYPHVVDGDREKIVEELKKFTGTKLEVCVITADQRENKLIFSEKGSAEKEKEGLVSNYNVGDVLECEVTGVVDFGVFMKIQEGLEGLAHISEIDWSLVENPRALYKVGDRVRAKIIEVKDGKISLSIKALKDNPWKAAAEKYKKDDKVSGVVIRHNKYGALVSIEEGVAGLVHVSDFSSEDELRRTLELGKTYPFVITLFEPDGQRMTLSYTKTLPLVI